MKTPHLHSRILAILLFIIAMVLYHFTMARTVPGGDSGELSYVACTWGIAHPPGYPLYTIISSLFEMLPFETSAYRVSLASAIPTAASASLLFLILAEITGGLSLPFSVALLFSGSHLVWRYAIVPEVFGLHLFFVALSTYLFLMTLKNPQNHTRWSLLLFFTFGLAAAHHHTIVLLGLPMSIAWAVWSYQNQKLNPKLLSLSFLATLPGLLIYLYLPLTSSSTKFTQWGDFSTWDGFLRHFLRKDYGTFKLVGSKDESNLAYNSITYLKSLSNEVIYAGVGFALFGAIAFFGYRLYKNRNELHKRSFMNALFMCWAFYCAVFFSLANLPRNFELQKEVMQRFYLQPNFVIWILFGLGLSTISWLFQNQIKHIKPIFLFLMAAVTLYEFNREYRLLNRVGNDYIQNYGKDILDPLPPGSVFLVSGDVIHNSVGYLQYCENYRTDIRAFNRTIIRAPGVEARVRHKFPEVQLPPNPQNLLGSSTFNLKEFFDKNYRQYPIYLSRITPGSWEDKQRSSWGKEYRLLAHGLLSKLYHVSDMPTYPEYLNILAKLKPESYFDRMPNFPDTEWEHYIRNDYMFFPYEVADTLLRVYGKDGHEMDPIKKGLKLLFELEKKYPHPFPDLYKNLAMAYRWLLAAHPQYLIPMVEVLEKLEKQRESGKFNSDFGPGSDYAQHKAVYDYYRPRAEKCKTELSKPVEARSKDCAWNGSL